MAKPRIQLHGFLIFLTLTIVIGLFLLKNNLIFINWQNEFPDEITDFIGIFLFLMGFLIRITARGYKSSTSRAGEQLVVDGIYAFTRNPMYLGVFLIGSGIILTLFQWWTLLLFITVFLAIYYPVMTKEEKILTERFGFQYTNYCRHTSKFIPTHSVKFIGYIFTHAPLQWNWLKKEIFSFIFVLISVIVIESYLDGRSFGAKELGEEIGEIALYIIGFTFIILVSKITHLILQKNHAHYSKI